MATILNISSHLCRIFRANAALTQIREKARTLPIFSRILLIKPGQCRVADALGCDIQVRTYQEKTMKLFKLAKTFRNDEDGAVTVDWVVLTAAVVGLGIAVLTQVTSGTSQVTSNVSTQLSGTNVTTTF